MAEFELGLNPALDAAELAKRYAEDNFICIENLFPPQTAEAIYQILTKGTPWYNVHSDAEGKHKYYTQSEWQNLSPDQKKQTISSVYQRAREDFSYLYYVYPMVDNYVDGIDPEWPLHALTEFLNSDEFSSTPTMIWGWMPNVGLLMSWDSVKIGGQIGAGNYCSWTIKAIPHQV
jgi:Rps23 Pro-64 3,4-dihydroxylase Tpa1-like proline 4-hydroxylase